MPVNVNLRKKKKIGQFILSVCVFNFILKCQYGRCVVHMLCVCVWNGEVLLTLLFSTSKIRFKNNFINPKNVTVEIKWLFSPVLTTCLQCWFANTWNLQIKFYGTCLIYCNLSYKEIHL